MISYNHYIIWPPPLLKLNHLRHSCGSVSAMLQYVCCKNSSTLAAARPDPAPAPGEFGLSQLKHVGTCDNINNWIGDIERGVPEPQKIRLNVWDMPNLFKNDVQEVWMVVSRAKSPYFLASSPRKHCLVRAKRPRPMPKSCKNAVRQTWMPVKCQTGWNQGKLQQILGTSFLVITLVPKQSFDEPLGPWGRFRWRGGALRIICRILRLFRFRFRCSAVIGLYAPKPWLQNA